jgi:hypothetical protein
VCARAHEAAALKASDGAAIRALRLHPEIARRKRHASKRHVRDPRDPAMPATPLHSPRGWLSKSTELGETP